MRPVEAGKREKSECLWSFTHLGTPKQRGRHHVIYERDKETFLLGPPAHKKSNFLFAI
jgi:hypothetical protein